MADVSHIPVIAAVVRRGERLLVGQRPVDKRHGGLWEFPGGKLDPGETPFQGTARELREELDLTVRAVGKTLLVARDAGSAFVISFVETEVVGEARALEHTEIGWFTPSQLARMPLAPCDARFVATLLPRVEE